MAYRKWTTAKKGLKELAYAFGAGTFVTVAMEAARSKWPVPWGPEQDPEMMVVLFAALVGGLKSLRNWIKERRKRRREERRVRNLDGFRG